MGEKRRGAGEGSIYRRKDGRWVGQYEADGKRRYVYGKDRDAVRARLTKALADRDAGLVSDSRNLTVAEYVPLWLDSIENAVGPRTWKRHGELTRLHIVPRLGSTKLDALRVQSLYREKLDAGLSPTWAHPCKVGGLEAEYGPYYREIPSIIQPSTARRRGKICWQDTGRITLRDAVWNHSGSAVLSTVILQLPAVGSSGD